MKTENLSEDQFQFKRLIFTAPCTTKKRRKRRIPEDLSEDQQLGQFSPKPVAQLWLTSPEHLTRTVCEAYAATNIRRAANGGRHSCITHQSAPTSDVAGTVVESGNSPEVINSAYRGLATETDGERYFRITPTRFNE